MSLCLFVCLSVCLPDCQAKNFHPHKKITSEITIPVWEYKKRSMITTTTTQFMPTTTQPACRGLECDHIRLIALYGGAGSAALLLLSLIAIVVTNIRSVWSTFIELWVGLVVLLTILSIHIIGRSEGRPPKMRKSI